MKIVRSNLATLFVMLCILLQATLCFAQTPFSIIEPKLEGKGLDLQSLNELNLKSSQLTAQQRKDSFKFYIISSPFDGQMGEIGATATPKALITGKFDRELLKAIAQLMIDEMQTVDRLSPFSLLSSMMNEPKYDVNNVWDCLWVETIIPMYHFLKDRFNLSLQWRQFLKLFIFLVFFMDKLALEKTVLLFLLNYGTSQMPSTKNLFGPMVYRILSKLFIMASLEWARSLICKEKCIKLQLKCFVMLLKKISKKLLGSIVILSVSVEFIFLKNCERKSRDQKNLFRFSLYSVVCICSNESF
jgi:hypothetical protein